MTTKKADFLKMLKENKTEIKEKNKNRELTEVELFLPEIHAQDNILAIKIKEIIINERINIKNLDWESENEKNNFKGGLRNNAKMSVFRFERWLELLGKDYEVTVFDKE